MVVKGSVKEAMKQCTTGKQESLRLTNSVSGSICQVKVQPDNAAFLLVDSAIPDTDIRGGLIIRSR